MKVILLILSIILIGCNEQKKTYTERGFEPARFKPIINADQNGRTKDTSKLFSGTLINSKNISFHRNSSCSNEIISMSKLSFESGNTSIPLPTEGLNNIYIQITTNGDKVHCYNTPVRIYDRDTTPPILYPNNSPIVSNTLLTPNIRKVNDSAISVSGGLDIDKVTYYSDANCVTIIGSGISLSNIALTMPLNQVTRIRATYEDDLGNATGCIDTAIDFEHETILPTITLNSFNSPVTSFERNINLKGTFSGTSILAPNVASIIIHKNSPTCSNTGLSSNQNISSIYTGSGLDLVVDNLVNTKYYARVLDSAGNQDCVLLLDYNHITGPADEANSAWLIEKQIVSSSTPELNKVTLTAKDVNNNPVSNASVVLVLKDLRGSPVADVDLTLSEVGTTGVYQNDANLTYSYSVNIKTGSLPSFSNRFIGNVYATNTPYCFTNGRDTLDGYNDLGAGTSQDPYQICHAVQLKDLANNCNSTIDTACDKDYKLMNNINLADWYSQGTPASQEFIFSEIATEPFEGEFNGNGLSIINYRYTQNTNQFLGMFGYGANAKVNNLIYSYEYSSPTATEIGGLFYDLSGVLFNLNNLNISGNIVGNTSAKVGGVVYNTETQSGEFYSNTINITVSDMAEGGIIGNVFKSTGTSIDFYENELNATITQSAQTSITNLGGMMGVSENVLMLDNIFKVNMDLNNVSATSNVGGIAGVFRSSDLETSYILGEIDETNTGVNNLGGMMGIVESSSSMIFSFALVDINLGDCTNKCGKVIGDTLNPTSAFFDGLYSSQQTELNLGAGSLNTSVVETEIDVSFQPNYFFDPLNPPLDEFFFPTVWESNLSTNDYPSLNR